MAIETFNRTEKKYLVDANAFEALHQWIQSNLRVDGYYTINNLYYDTFEHDLIKHSLSKPLFKEKIRLRTYGVPQGNDTIFIELKKKYKGVVYKRRSKITLQEAYDLMSTSNLPKPNAAYNHQVLSEIKQFTHMYTLKPTMIVSYDRKAYGTGDLRITIDENIMTRSHQLDLSQGIYGDALLPKDLYLIEIKASQSMPIALSQLLSEQKIYPASFSKYGTAYTKGVTSSCSKPYLLTQMA